MRWIDIEERPSQEFVKHQLHHSALSCCIPLQVECYTFTTMSRGVYYLWPVLSELSDLDNLEASSSIAPSSSPEFPPPPASFPPGPFNSVTFPEVDDEDLEYIPPQGYRLRTNNDEKAIKVLWFMKLRFPRFSLWMLLDTIFAKDVSKTIKEYAGNFMKDDGLVRLMDKLYNLSGSEMSDWVVKTAGDVCAREASGLTARASRSGHTENANFFRVVSKQLTVEMVKSFRVPDLTKQYVHLAPNLQCILKAVIRKEGKLVLEGSQNPDDVSHCISLWN
jgi:hypothetical protein